MVSGFSESYVIADPFARELGHIRTALCSSVSAKGLPTPNVEGNLLTEEVNRNNNDKGKSNSALIVKGRSNNREKKGKRWQSRSKSRDPKAKSDIECYYCGKKGHMKRDCTKWKEEKGKGKDSELEEKKKSSVKIQEINVMENSSQDSDDSKEIYFTCKMDYAFLTTKDGYALSDWYS